MMHLEKTNVLGCYEIYPVIHRDDRGYFVKTFHHDVFVQNGLETRFAEEYYTFSQKDVLRGMHFQLPPYEHTKMVYCINGEVKDVVVDLRIGSPTYGRFNMVTLNAEKANMIYIPPGLAHGFYVTSDNAILLYKVTTVYSPMHDTGILWNSIEIPWPNRAPVISKRDRDLGPFVDFKSPFYFKQDRLSDR